MTAQALEPTPAGQVGATPHRAGKPPRPILRMVIMLLLVGVALFMIFGFGIFRNIMIGKFLAKLKNPPQTVATIIAEKTPFQRHETATGTLIARQGAALSAQIAGIVQTIDFHSGDDVHKGQLLLTLRPNNDDALLAQLQATASLDRVTYQRDLAQYHAQAVSMQTVDTDRANLASAEAQVKSQQALMAEKKIYAPFSGRIGIRQVDLGQYLAAGTTIASLETLNPIDIDFYLPQAALRTIHPGMKIKITVNAFEATPFTGTIDALDSSVSTTTRMIQVRATLDNPHNELRPGMFARVAIDVGAPHNLVTLPQTAIAYNPYGDTVFLAVKDKNSPNSAATGAAGQAKTTRQPSLQARQVFVTLGSARGDQVSVVKGVTAGEQVVVAGQMKLRNGTPLLINNKILPPNLPDPVVPNH
ncbi:efflux RND transporter periplasmic adaptor subunit [Acidiphilium sp. PA]|uniref:efflux RND transporter periplasmic adaptor subunit n=1 Tax=Acidiphilium sp. PA TaxID=2871705 RepID=UPI0022432D86|nr:efflux RND transporter periplasmic adaptor subunit [Acidiphilium sp. PA]MCW8307657.1 efflux RND transporter periplasmic adaptor subunit [Acidiphilium sp. PA]